VVSIYPDGPTASCDAPSGYANRHGVFGNSLGCLATQVRELSVGSLGSYPSQAIPRIKDVSRTVPVLPPTRLDVGSSAQQVIALSGSA
jgi:hypothetical protein